jgi:hypothetical protein
LDWLENRLAADDAAVVAQAIEADPALQAQVAWLRDFLNTSSQVVLVDPPAGIHQQATARFAAYAEGKRSPGLVRTFIAALTADNWQRLPLAGVRNVSLRSEPRQVVYSSELADVALNIHAQPGSERFDLEGQVFALADSTGDEFVVQLLQGGVEKRLAVSDDLGKFSLSGLPAGVYELLVSSEQGEIEIGPLGLA